MTYVPIAPAYGHFFHKKRLPIISDAIRPFLQGKRVLDIGAGTGAHADFLLHLGAAHVTAIEPELTLRRASTRQMQWHTLSVLQWCGHAERYPGDVLPEVGFLSYPLNYHIPGLLRAESKVETLIYYGSNDYATACGTVELFRRLLTRPVLLHITWGEPRECLTVYGKRPPTASILEDPVPRKAEEWTDEELFVLGDVEENSGIEEEPDMQVHRIPGAEHRAMEADLDAGAYLGSATYLRCEGEVVVLTRGHYDPGEASDVIRIHKDDIPFLIRVLSRIDASKRGTAP